MENGANSCVFVWFCWWFWCVVSDVAKDGDSCDSCWFDDNCCWFDDNLTAIDSDFDMKCVLWWELCWDEMIVRWNEIDSKMKSNQNTNAVKSKQHTPWSRNANASKSKQNAN